MIMAFTQDQRFRQQAKNRRVYALFMGTWLARKVAMEEMYLQDGLSQKEIAKVYEVDQVTVQKAMTRLGIPMRTRGRRGKEHHGYKTGEWSVLYRTMILKEECEECGTTDGLVIHHRNNDHYDNRVTNLEVLCSRHHQSEHKKAWWAAKKAGLPLPKSNAPVRWHGRLHAHPQ